MERSWEALCRKEYIRLSGNMFEDKVDGELGMERKEKASL